VRAFDLEQGLAHRLDQDEAAPDVALDEVDDGFGVRFRAEDGALGGQLLAQLEIVLDDAVVDHHDLPGVADMGCALRLLGTP